MRDEGRTKVVRKMDAKEKEREEEINEVEDRETPLKRKRHGKAKPSKYQAPQNHSNQYALQIQTFQIQS